MAGAEITRLTQLERVAPGEIYGRSGEHSGALEPAHALVGVDLPSYASAWIAASGPVSP